MNEISRDLSVNNGNYSAKNKKAPQQAKEVAMDTCASSSDMENSMEYWGNVNQACLKSTSNRTQDSVREFLKDPETIQGRVELEDLLMERGYSQEDALKKADMFYRALKEEKIYKD